MRIRRRCALAALAYLIPVAARAQTPPPGTEIYLARLRNADGGLQIERPVNLTNRPGYDNQPSFGKDGTYLLYTSIRDDGQADTYRYVLSSMRSEQVTHTRESEYSPTPLPSGDGFSVVRVEADSTQRLWRFPLDGTDPTLLLEQVKPVGYHAWSDERTVVLYVLGEPATLQIVDLKSGAVRVAGADVGRSLHRIPGGPTVSFMQHTSDDQWWIRELDPKTGTSSPLVQALTGSQDYAWMPNASILMAQETRIFRCTPGRSTDWVQVVDLADAGVGRITRLAVSPDGTWLALVADELAAP